MSRPGVMIYFSTRAGIKRLTNEEKGILFDAVLDYGEFGRMPSFDERPLLAVAWDFIKPMIDADGDAYQQKVKSAKKSANARWAKERAETCERMRTDATVCERMRTDADDANTIQSNSNTIQSNGNTEIKADKPPGARFVKPSIAEVQMYCVEKGLHVDAEAFCDYYEANGWVVGRSRMKDWRAAVRNWERRNKSDEVEKDNDQFAKVH